jgi:hypothetical protein
VTSTCFEGRTCLLVHFGHNRDGDKHLLIIVYGVMADGEGRRVLPVSLGKFASQTHIFQFAGLLVQHGVGKVSCAQAPLELLDDGPHLHGRLMGTGNIEGPAATPVLEARRAGGALHIAEDPARDGMILMGAES